MARCEDFPCCGHGDEGCPDMDRLNVCKQCNAQFHPDNTCWDYCPRCNAEYQIRHGYMDSDGFWVEGEDEGYDFRDDEE